MNSHYFKESIRARPFSDLTSFPALRYAPPLSSPLTSFSCLSGSKHTQLQHTLRGRETRKETQITSHVRTRARDVGQDEGYTGARAADGPADARQVPQGYAWRYPLALSSRDGLADETLGWCRAAGEGRGYWGQRGLYWCPVLLRHGEREVGL